MQSRNRSVNGFSRIFCFKFEDGVGPFTNMKVYVLILQLLLFVTKNESEKVLTEFQEAAKSFKGKV